MSDEIELIADSDGVAVIGDPAVVDRFLTAEGLTSTDLGLPRLGASMNAAASALQAGSEIAAQSGRWVKLTEKSAQALKHGNLMNGSTGGVGRAVVTKNGKITGILEIAKPGAWLTNPALLAGAAGLMAQLAMQQAMDEITDYLAAIDAKVDDVLRAQKDAVLAQMIGAGFLLDEAVAVRSRVGRVSEVTWTKVQGTLVPIVNTQVYALRQLDALAEKLERTTKVGELARATTETQGAVQEWLAVLARCVQLQDAAAVLELDRVLDASPDEVDQHRAGLRAAREERLGHIARSTEQLLARMNGVADTVNTKVLLHPTAPRTVVRSNNDVVNAVVDFNGILGIGGDDVRQLEARRWVEAASEVRGRALDTGAQGVDAARRLGSEALDRTRGMTGRLASRFAERARRGPDGGTASEGDRAAVEP